MPVANIAEEFKHFVQILTRDPDNELSGQGVQEWTVKGIARLDSGQRRAVRLYLGGLLDSGVDNEELLRVWQATSPGYHIGGDNGLRPFFAMIVEEIDKAASPG